MASTLKTCLLTIFIGLILTVTESRVVRAPFKPNALVLPVRKDTATNLQITNLRKRTPQVSVPLVVDLNGRFLWVTCDQNYLSSTYNAPFCHSTQCARAGVHYCHKCSSTTARPGCHNNTCGVLATNPLTQKNVISELAEDVVSIRSIDQASNPSQWATIPQFLFACAPSSLLQGPLPQGLASHFGFRPQFALCLSSSTTNNGGIFFGNLPSKVPPGVIVYTPLTIGAQGEYFILLRSIKINNQTRRWGTMISTTKPYTVLEHSVFKTFTQFFADQLVAVPQVEAISPFGLCFNASILPPTRGDPPNIDFVLQNRNVMRPNVSCLAFVDGGSNARAAITIGAYQLEDNFIHFDLLRSRVGFIRSRLSQPFKCSNFNFTSAELTLEFDAMGD
ncbi:hypothetical protein Pfo_031272 [Paulownia fortunei]|nr:hypothetical protein Pfo_031272 [Paulownia fortunei]